MARNTRDFLILRYISNIFVLPPTSQGQKEKYFNEIAVIIWYDQERRQSLNIVERDLLMDNRVQLDTIRGDLPGRSAYV